MIDIFGQQGGFNLGKQPVFVGYNFRFDGFEPVDIDLSKPENATFMRRYYRHELKRVLSKHDELIITKPRITDDLQVWK